MPAGGIGGTDSILSGEWELCVISISEGFLPRGVCTVVQMPFSML